MAPTTDRKPNTGLPGLERVFRGLTPGDNVVWQVDSITDVQPFVLPYCQAAVADERKLVYFRFARHDPLVSGLARGDHPPSRHR